MKLFSDVPDRIQQIVVKYIARESPSLMGFKKTGDRQYPAFPPRFFRTTLIKRNPRKVKTV